MDANVIFDLGSLNRALKSGRSLKYLFFWGHRAKSAELGRECLSQWYEAPFTLDGQMYATAEHYMMAEKARIFGANVIASEIAKARTAGAAKALGRSVPNFDETVWIARRKAVVVQGNLAKFSQNADLCNYLINTADRVLVEASPQDRIWGIGMAVDDARCQHPEQWRGLNLLGFALMEVRRQLTDTPLNHKGTDN